MSEPGSEHSNVTYETPMQCDECLGRWTAEFDDPEESFLTTCPHCGAHCPEVYV